MQLLACAQPVALVKVADRNSCYTLAKQETYPTACPTIKDVVQCMILVLEPWADAELRVDVIAHLSWEREED